MIIAHTYKDLKIGLDNIVYEKTVGFVPTMGALHIGHLSLIEQAKKENDIVVVSIFVNPTQFNSQTDFEKYPRDINKDLEMLRSTGCDLVFVPSSPDEVYNDTYVEINPNLDGMDAVMEGEFRPGHFHGVVNVVNQLFKLVQPEKAYFGKKDFQQLAIIKHMVKKLKLSVQIVEGETLRETNGLAYSSRNERLDSNTRKNAGVIYQSLMDVKRDYLKYSLKTVLHNAESSLNNAGFKVEYITVCDSNSLNPISEWHESDNLTVCLAVFANDVRLIDNLSFSVN